MVNHCVWLLDWLVWLFGVLCGGGVVVGVVLDAEPLSLPGVGVCTWSGVGCFSVGSGVRWLVSDSGRMVRVREGAEFFARMFDFNAPRICVENPVQHTPARECHGKGRPAQYVHPWQFGHMEQKKTGLWLRNLPKLVPTDVVKEEMMKLPVKDRLRLNWLPATKDRAKIRSKTFQGIADAMAAQWGVL